MTWGDLSPENEQKIKGATDDTLIGNLSDRLKVESSSLELKVLLEEMLEELKLIRHHMQKITDDNILTEDINDRSL